MASANKRAIGYIRVSTMEQATEGVSLEAQRARIEAYATMRGLELTEMIVDAGVSAGKPIESRPGGAALLRALRRRENAPKAVIAWKLDRLFRNAGDCLATVEAWERRGLSLHLIDLGGATLDTSTAVGKLFLTMLAGFAEFERNTTGERTAAALGHKKKKGERVGQVPFGFEADGAELVKHQGEQKTIAAILKLRRSGLSLRAIAEELDSDPEMKPRGKRWHPTTVRRILAAA
jgi:DNA invertase Pin-like site-specific DNA recombinase